MSCGTFHSPAPSSRSACLGTVVGSISNARQNDLLAATSVRSPLRSIRGAVEEAITANARLRATSGCTGAWGAMAAPFLEIGGSRSESHTRVHVREID